MYNECGGQNFDAPTQGICSNFSVLNDDPDLALGNNDVEGGSGDRGTGKKHVCRGGENGGGTNEGGNDRGVDSRVVSLRERFIHASGVVFYSLNFTQLTVPLVTSATKGTRQREKKEELPLEQDGPGFQEKGPSAVQFSPLQLFKSQSTINSVFFLNRSFVFFLLLLSLALDPAAGVLSITDGGAACTLVNNNACVTHAKYPNNYEDDKGCTISSDAAGATQVIDFDIEYNADCSYDYIEVKSIKYCGSLTNPGNSGLLGYVALNPGDTFKWKSDGGTSGKGFKICVLAVCSVTNGQQNNSVDCLCGTATCTSLTGLYCMSAMDRCGRSAMEAACSVTNGTRANSAACSCGTSDCTLSNGLYCLKSSNHCSSQPSCTNVDGSVENTKACTCGTSECSTSNGLFCTESTNQCSTEASCHIVNGKFFIVVIFLRLIQ